MIFLGTFYAMAALGCLRVGVGDGCALCVQRSNFCVLFLHLHVSLFLQIYSPDRGVTAYKNIAKIPRRTDSSCFLRGRSESHFGRFSSKTEILEKTLRNHAENHRIIKNF